MRWIDFPPVAEFEDRHGVIRPIRGCTIFGRFEFADRLAQIHEILNAGDSDSSWEEIYQNSPRLQHSVARALDCWGIDINWLVPSQIEQLLLCRGNQPGWLLELATTDNSPAQKSQDESQTLAQTLAEIATGCQSLTEALELANMVPAELLRDILTAKNTPPEDKKKQHLKQNFDRLMAESEGLHEVDNF